MKHKKLIGILATSALLLGSVASFAACGGGKHTIERVDETPATCTEGGHGAYYRCTDDGCDKIFSDIEGKHEIKWDDVEKTDPLGHSMTHVDAKAADCTEDGANEHYHCGRCEKNFTDEAGSAEKTDAVIPALGHDMKVVDKVIPVTGHPGVKAHYRCERDHEEYFDSFGDKKVTNDNRHELEYDMLTTAPNGWYSTVTDYSHTNDADPYVTITSENGLNAATSEYYTDLAFTARVQKSGGAKQFILLFFENKTIYSVCVEKGKITYNDSWCGWDYDSSGYTLIEDEWDGHTVSAGERDCYEGDGLEVTLARTGKTVKVLVNGQEVHSATLADAYEAEPAKGATIVHDAKPGVEYHFHVEPQAQAPAAPQVNVASVDAAQGAVTLNKETFEYGDELVITVTPTENYLLDQLLVNGREVSSLVSQGKYTTTATSVVNVSAVFKVKEYGSVNAGVTGKKHGVTGNAIAQNAAFELIGKNENYTGTLTDGTLSLEHVLTGEYTVRIAGYIDGKLTVEKDTACETAVALEYDMFSILKKEWDENEGYYWLTDPKYDFAHQNDANAYISALQENDGFIVAYTNDDYDDLYITATFKEGNADHNKKAIQLVFDDGKGIQFGLRQDDNGVWFGHWYTDRYLLNKGDENHTERLAPEEIFGYLNAAQLTKFNGDGITVSVARKGNKIALFVDGELVRMMEVGADYATKKCKPAIIVEWAKAQNIGVAVSEALPEFTAPTFTLTQGEHGTVTKTSGDTYSVWDKITLTIKPDTNYRLKQLTVNGTLITGNKTEYSFFPVEGENTVVPVFEQIPYGSVNAEIVGKKHGVTGNAIADGTKVALIGADNVKYENVTVTGGKISIDDVVAGTYTVKIDGYFDGTITVLEGTAYETIIVLEYDLLCEENMTPWGLTTDVSHQNDGEAYIEVTSGGGHVNIFTNDRYNDIVFSATFKAGNSWRERKGIMLAFEDKKGVQIGFDSFDRENEVTLYFWGAMQSGDNAQVGANEKYIFESTDRLCANTRFDVCNPITGELYNKYKTTGLELSVVRDGNKILVLLDGKTVGAVTVDEEYADDTVVVGVFTEWAEPHQIPFELSETLPDFATPTFTLTQGQNGTVTKTSGDTYSVWEKITLEITPDSNYRLKQLTVNGVAIAGNKTEYSFYPVAGENTVVAEFEQIPYGSVNAEIVGKKHGVTGNAIEGAKVTLIGADNVKYENVTVTGGKISIDDVVAGTYTVKIDGYFDGTITVLEGTAYETAIVLEYSMFTVNATNGIGANKVDLTHQNDEDSYINVTGDGGHLNVTANERYNDVMVTATFKRENVWNQRMGFLLAFSDKEGVQLGFDTFDDKNNVTLHFWYDGFKNGYQIARDYYNFNSWKRLNGAFDLNGCAPLKEAWLAKFNGDGLQVSLVRKGNVILALVEGEIVGAVEVNSKYATDTVQLGFFAEWVKPMKLPFEITTTLPDFAVPTFELTQGANGTVTKTSGDTYSVWEKITLAIAPASNYRLKQLTVNGVVVSGDKTEYSFFPVAGANTVAAEFEQIPYGSVNAEITGKKHGVTGNALEGAKVSLIGADNVKYENLTVTNGKIAVDKVIAGTYTVKAEGYFDGSITIPEGAAYETEITLEYDMFTTNGWYDQCQDFTHQNDENAYVALSKEDGVNFVTKNGYDQVAITVTIGKDFYKHERAGVLMKFGDSMVWFTVKQQNGAPVGFEWYGMPHAWGGNAVVDGTWGFDGAAFTDEDTESWNNGTMKLTLVRDGNKFYAFVNGTLRATLTADSAFATQKTQAGLRVEGSQTEGHKWYVSVEEDISAYLAKLPTE